MAQSESQLLLARQPIYNSKMQVFANELQYQAPPRQQYTKADVQDKAAAKAIVNAYTSADEFEMFDDLPVFIRVSSRLLLSGYLMSLPPTNIILDITDDLPTDEQGLLMLKKYRRNKFRFAITLNQHNYRSHPYLNFANFIRLDLQQTPFALLSKLYQRLRQSTSGVRLIICGVQTPENMHYCRSIEADLVQGHFLSQPAIVKDRQLSIPQTNSLQLVGELQSENISPKRIAQLLSQSPELSYRLLRLINSATYELTRTIESLQEAVIYLGLNVICHWVSLMLLADSSGKPKALILSTLIRAQMSQSLCQKLNPHYAEKAFLVGLFSTLDAMLDISMSQALAKLPLSDEINQALLDNEGELGQVIHAVIAYEQGNFSDAKQSLALPDYQLFVAYGEAVMWAKGVCSELFH